MSIKIWQIALVGLVGTYFLTGGSQIVKLINVVDTYIYFIYLQIIFNIVLLGVVFFVTSKVAALTMFPGFITNNFVTNFAAESLKERGVEKLEGFDKIKGIKEKLDKFQMFPLLIQLFVSIGSLVSAYMLVNAGENFTKVNNEVVLLLGINVMFISYFFYKQINAKTSKTTVTVS